MHTSADWLRQKYIVEGLSMVEIGRVVQRDPKTILHWMRKFGIPTRPRGSDVRQHFVVGQQSPFTGRRHSSETKAKLSAIRKLNGHFPKDQGQPYWKGKTGSAHPLWQGGATPERQAFYSTAEWKAARLQAYANAGGRCQKCGCSAGNAAARNTRLDVHHVFPFAFKEKRASVRNLRILCGPCHRFVHSPGNVEREFLPPYGVFPLVMDDGTSTLVKIGYRPTHLAGVPIWMK